MSTTQPMAMVAPPREFDLAAAPAAREHFEDAIRSVSARLAIDLRQVDFIDSTGLAAMIAARNTAVAAGGEVVLVGASERIIKLLVITGTSELFELVATPEEIHWRT